MSSSQRVISSSPSIAAMRLATSPSSHGRSVIVPSVSGGSGTAMSNRLADGGDDLGRETRKRAEKLGAFRLQARDVLAVLLAAPEAFVEAPRLQNLDVVDPGHRGG